MLSPVCTPSCWETLGDWLCGLVYRLLPLGTAARVKQASAVAPALTLWVVFAAGDMPMLRKPWCTHKAPADQHPGSTWITINRAFGSGSDSTLAVIQDQFRSGGDSGRSPIVDWLVAFRKPPSRSHYGDFIHNFRGLLEWAMFAPWVIENALPCFHPRCGIKSPYSFKYLSPTLKNRRLFVSHRINLGFPKSL